jgi:hypothetical protein
LKCHLNLDFEFAFKIRLQSLILITFPLNKGSRWRSYSWFISQLKVALAELGGLGWLAWAGLAGRSGLGWSGWAGWAGLAGLGKARLAGLGWAGWAGLAGLGWLGWAWLGWAAPPPPSPHLGQQFLWEGNSKSQKLFWVKITLVIISSR